MPLLVPILTTMGILFAGSTAEYHTVAVKVIMADTIVHTLTVTEAAAITVIGVEVELASLALVQFFHRSHHHLNQRQLTTMTSLCLCPFSTKIGPFGVVLKVLPIAAALVPMVLIYIISPKSVAIHLIREQNTFTELEAPVWGESYHN